MARHPLHAQGCWLAWRQPASLCPSEVGVSGDETVASNGLPGSKVEIEHVQAVIYLDAPNEFKCSLKLSSVHGSGGYFTKMKVGMALKQFKESPPGIRYLVKQGVINKKAETTGSFMELIVKWSTLMTTRHPTFALSKLYSSKHREALETLELAVTTIRGMKIRKIPTGNHLIEL